MTAIATKRTRKPSTNGNGHAVVDVHLNRLRDPPTAETRQVRFTLVEPRADNPRSDWADDEEFRQLVESIRRHGVLEPILVREKPGYHGGSAPRVGGRELALYEIAAGERRYRAAQVAGLAEIPVSIRRMNARELREIRYHENATRKDLTAIDQAREFQAMLDAGDAPGPTELAKRLGVSQAFVSSRLGLLKLPEKWQRKVISREMPPTHARCLAPYADQPAILKQIEDYTGGDYSGSVKEFERQVNGAARRATKEMSGKIYTDGREIPVFKPTEEQKAQLGIIKVANYMGKLEERATHGKLWAKLQEEHAKKWVKRHPKQAKRGAANAGKRRTLTAEEEQEAARKARERHARALSDFLTAWVLELAPAAIRAQANVSTAMVIAGHCATAGWIGSFFEQSAVMEKLLKPHGVKLERGKDRWSHEAKTGKALAELPNDDKRAAVLCEYYAQAIGELKPFDIGSIEVLDLAEALSIDLEEAWKTEQRGDRGRAFYELHSKEQLLELAKEWHVTTTPGLSKNDLIRIFQENCKKPLPFPKSLKKARPA